MARRRGAGRTPQRSRSCVAAARAASTHHAQDLVARSHLPREPGRSSGKHDAARRCRASVRGRLAPPLAGRNSRRTRRNRHRYGSGIDGRGHGEARWARAQRVIRRRPGVCVSRRRRNRRPEEHQQPGVFRSAGTSHHCSYRRYHARRLRVSRRYALAPLRRRGPPVLVVFGARTISHRPGAYLGALRLAQGTIADRQPRR